MSASWNAGEDGRDQECSPHAGNHEACDTPFLYQELRVSLCSLVPSGGSETTLVGGHLDLVDDQTRPIIRPFSPTISLSSYDA